MFCTLIWFYQGTEKQNLLKMCKLTLDINVEFLFQIVKKKKS